MSFDTIATRASRAAFDRASAALDELIILALVPGPLRKAKLRAAASPFGDRAFKTAITRLMQLGEIAAEGMTQARIYRLVQVTGIPEGAATPSTPYAATRTVCDEGVWYESIWPLACDPKAPPSALLSEEDRR